MTLRSRHVSWVVLYAVLAAVAFGARLALMLHGGGLLSYGGYDDGVYYSAADAFVFGRMPYADFLFIQPPGVILVTAPFAWLGSVTTDPTGFVVARLVFMAVGAFSTVLIAMILRRFGMVAAASGGLYYAVAYTAIYGERSVLLEPVGTLGILIGLLVLSRPRLRTSAGWLIVGGFAAGVASGFKIWYLVPALIIIAFAGRGWWKMLIGAIAGACAIYLPFFLPAPATSFREIVLDQLGRGSAGVPLSTRLQVIFGDYPLPHVLARIGLTQTGFTALTVGIAIAGSVVALTVRRARVFVVLLVVDVGILLAAPSFFLHYAALTTPMLALVFGVAMGRGIGLVRWRTVQVALVAATSVVLVLANFSNVLHGTGRSAPTQTLAAAANEVRGCVMAEDPTLLVLTDSLSRDLGQGCALWPDVTGYTYGPDHAIFTDGRPVPRDDNETWQHAVMAYLTSGSAVIVSRHTTGLDADSHKLLLHGQVLYHRPGLTVARTTTHES